MYCKHCGQLLEENVVFCHNCGKSVNETAAQQEYTQAEPVPFGGKFSDKSFYLATLFFTISVSVIFLVNLMAKNVSIPILEIFAIISFWRLHNSAKLGDPLVCFVSPLKTLRIIVQIQRVLMWIVIGIFAVIGILTILVGVNADSSFAEGFVDGFYEDFTAFGEFEELIGKAAEFFLANIGLFLIIFGAVIFFIAMICTIFNLTMYRSFYKCVASYEESAKFGVYNIEKQNSARNWLIFSLVCSCISALDILRVSSIASVLLLVAIVSEICYHVFFIKFLKAEN